jgi:L-rhamnose-H+ transport protein
VPSRLAVGFLLVSGGGFIDGSLGLTMKLVRGWRWEHLWLIFTGLGFGVIPSVIGFITVPDLTGVLGAARKETIATVFVFGVAWGIGAVLYGVALKFAGIGLSYPIVMSLTAGIGSVAPLLLFHRDELFTFRGHLILTAICLVSVGVIFCGWAAELREHVRSDCPPPNTPIPMGRQPVLGVLIAVMSGIFSPMINLSFTYGSNLADLASGKGASPLMAPNVIWVIALSAGAFVNVAYCGYLIVKHHSWNEMFGLSRDWPLSLGMALLAPSSLILYGIGTTQLGQLGSVIGWSMMSAMGILAANVWGFVTGEWKGVTRKTLFVINAAVVLLVAAIILLGWASNPFVNAS